MNSDSAMPLSVIILLLAGPTAIASFLICWIMRYLSPALGYLDRPAGHKAHGKPTPLGGGLAIMIPMILAIAGGLLVILLRYHESIASLDWLANHRPGIILRSHQVGGVLLAGLILHVLGLFDDVKDLGPWIKLIFQTAAAGLVVIGFGVRLHLFVPIAPLSIATTIIWIVVITNAFNFLDNADGLCAGVALICTAVLLAVAVSGGQVFVSAYLACFAGVLVGFLVHNFPPARIFLGDAGSLPIGFFLAVGSILTIYYHQQDPSQTKTAVLIPLVVMAIPLYDFVSVVYLRYRRGVSPFRAENVYL